MLRVQIIGKIINVKTVEFGKGRKRFTFVDVDKWSWFGFKRTQMGSRIIKINEISVIFGNALRLMVPTYVAS
jgi:ATP-dependent DNA helicase RecG